MPDIVSCMQIAAWPNKHFPNCFILKSVTEPQLLGLNVLNSLGPFKQNSSTSDDDVPLLIFFKGPQLDLALNFLIWPISRGVDYEVMIDLWIVGSVTVDPSAVFTVTASSASAFSLVDHLPIWAFVVYHLHYILVGLFSISRYWSSERGGFCVIIKKILWTKTWHTSCPFKVI